MIRHLSFLPVKQQGPWLLLGLILLMLTLLSGLALLMLSGWFISASALAGLGMISMINIFTPGAGIRLAALTRTVARYGERLATHAATLKLLTSLRMDLFSRLIRRPELEIEQLQRGDALSRLTADIDTLDHLYLAVFQPAAGALLLTLTTIVLTAVISFDLALFVLVPLLLANLLIVSLCHFIGQSSSREQALAYPELRQTIMDGLETRLELRALGQLDAYCLEVENQSDAIIKRGQRLADLDAIGGALVLLSSLFAIVVMLWLGLAKVAAGELSGAVLAAIILGLFAVSEAWLSLPSAWRRLSQSQIAAGRVQALIAADADTEPVARVQRWPAEADLSLQAVSFSWAPHQPALFRDFSLSIKAGERIAIMGQSGCGKTTLLRLILNQIQPQQGTISIGGVALPEINNDMRRKKVAYLPQNPVLFRDSVAGNLALARANASDSDMLDALKLAGLEGWLADQSLGLNTWIDEAAGNLSGGEQRRLAMARLFLSDPEIVLLDEPTASLDDKTLLDLKSSLDQWLKGRTTLLVTHRLDHLPAFDRVLRLG